MVIWVKRLIFFPQQIWYGFLNVAATWLIFLLLLVGNVKTCLFILIQYPLLLMDNSQIFFSIFTVVCCFFLEFLNEIVFWQVLHLAVLTFFSKNFQIGFGRTISPIQNSILKYFQTKLKSVTYQNLQKSSTTN